MENYIAKFNEYVQRTKSSLSYEDVGCDGPDHIRRWVPWDIWRHVGGIYVGLGESGRLLLHDGAWQEMQPDMTLSADYVLFFAK